MDVTSYENNASCVVNVNWNADDGKWNVNTWRRDDNRWNAGNRAFSRKCCFSPDLIGWEFCL